MNRWKRIGAVIAAMGMVAGAAKAETIENRDGKSLIATWWGADSAAPFVYTLDFGNTQRVHSAPYSLRFDYDKANHPSNANSFVSAMGRWNFRNYDYLSFWVYNSGTPLRVRIRLEDKNGNPWESNWANIEPQTTTTNADWENLTVDLTRSFAATNVDFTAIQQLMFIVAPDDQNARGTFWLDDIELTRAPNQAPLEPFESDFYGWAGGGVFSNMTNTTEQFQNGGAAENLGQKSLKVWWGAKAANYDNFTYTPFHDPAAPADRIGRYTNFTLSGNNTVEAWVKSTTDNNLPILVKLSGSSGTSDVATVNYTGAGNWQKLTWNFSTQATIAARLQTVWIFPYPNQADGGGTLYLDNLGLAGGAGPAIPVAPTSVTTTATAPDGDGVYTVRWSSVTGITDYQVHESTNVNFSTFTTIHTNGTSIRFAKSVPAAGMTYYYRIASRLVSGGVTNVGCFSPPAIATVKTIPAAARRYEILDNFDGQKLVAAWWGSDPSSPYCYVQDFANTQRVHRGTRSLRIDYDKANDTNSPYSFLSAMGSYNLRNFDYFSFWVYNSGSVVRFRVRLEDDQGRPWESNWANIEPTLKTASADWENLVVDLTRSFSAHMITNINMEKITQVMFMIEPGGITNRGTLWMDDLEFHRAPNSAPIEVFESDFYGWAAGGPFTVVTSTAAFRNDGSQTGLGQHALRVTWTNKLADYSNFGYTLAHDASASPTGRIGRYTNLAAGGNTFAELWAYSATETNLPILLKLDGMDVSIQNYTTPGAWQRLTWDYSQAPNRGSVTTMVFYPFPNGADAGGTLYLDDLSLVGGAAPAVPYAPTSLSASAVSSGNFTLRWNSVSGVSGYLIQESLAADFGSVSAVFTSTAASRVISKDPYTGGGTYYYRVRSYLGSVTTAPGSCSAPIAVTVQPETNLKGEMLDGFDANGIATTWWAVDGAAPYVYAMDFANTQRVHSGARSLKVSYNKANDANNAYSFFSCMGQFNLRNFDYLSFWVFNTGASLRVNVRLEDRQGNPWESGWAGIHPQTLTAAADWENLVVDLTRAFSANNLNMEEITQIMFMVAPGSDTEVGEFWLDDLQLSRAVNSAPLEVFESDTYGWAAGTNFPMAMVSSQFHNDGTVKGLGQQSLRINWTNKGVNYDNFIYQPAHDAGAAPLGRIGNYRNFLLGSNRYAELWVKSTTDTNLPILLKFDDYDIGVRTYTGTGQWQRLLWDYSAMPRATNVDIVWFFPYPAAADAGGTMFLDDFNLLGGAIPVIPYAPSPVRATPVVTGCFTLSWGAVPGASGYRIQESSRSDFNTLEATYTLTATSRVMVKTPYVGGRFYYRVASYTLNGATNAGSYSAPIAVDFVPEADLRSERLDGFDKDGNALTWWAIDGTAPTTYTFDFASTQRVHSGSNALKVTYNKANDANAYTFFSAMGQYNLRNYDYLSFWVYNTGAPLRIKVRLEDRRGNPFESGWAGGDPETKTTAADWENLVLDLTRTFGATNLDMSEITQVMFMVAPGSTNETGEFWLDDVQFSRAVNSAPLESFEWDSYGWMAGTNVPMSRVTTEKHNDGTVKGLGQHSLRIGWTNKAANYDNFIYEPKHDAGAAPAGRIGNYGNFRLNGNGFIEAWVKSATDNNLPILLKLDDADVSVKTYTGAGQWQRLVWDYSLLPGATNVGFVWFIPYPNQADAGGSLFIDDINLIGGSTPALPAVPPNLAIGPVSNGAFTVSWGAVAGAAGYELQESRAPDFAFGNIATYQTGTSVRITKDETYAFGTYYYRIRSTVPQGGQNTYGSYSRPVSVKIDQKLSATLGMIDNFSYSTPCAEMDNINIPLVHTNTTGYRITVTHPLSYQQYGTNILNERGADFDDCHFTDRTIWKIGVTDGSAAEFRQGGFGPWVDDFWVTDLPAAGIDEDWAQFPKEINNDWFTAQYIHFTADEDADVNLEIAIGSRLNVKFAMMYGQLEIRCWTWSGTNWTDQGTRIFNNGAMQHDWHIPDFTWRAGIDSNTVVFDVVTAAEGGQSTWGAWALYDSIEMRKRDEGGETVNNGFFDNGNVVLDTIKIDFWWRAPEDMTVICGGKMTNCHFFRINKRQPFTNYVGYSQVFVMYEDGNVRLLPHPPYGVDWTPFGASVILGPTEEGKRPFIGIDTVVVDPDDLSMDIYYDDGGSAHVELWVDEEQNVLDVSRVQHAKTNLPFARFRSMWVFDGKSDMDRLETAGGHYNIMEGWTTLTSTWWQFYKEAPTYHNTYCPDFKMEVTVPSKAFLVQQAEQFTSTSNGVISTRANASAGQVLTFGAAGGQAVYNIQLAQAMPAVSVMIGYSDDDGGNNGDYPGNVVQVYVNGQLKGSTKTVNTVGWEDFEFLPSIYLGDLPAGTNQIRIVVGGLTFGCDIDQLQFVSQPVAPHTRVPVLTRQGEAFNIASNHLVMTRAGAVGGQSLHFDLAGGWADYTFSVPTTTSNTYIQLRYVDEMAPTKIELFLDGNIFVRYPTRDGSHWEDWMLSDELYLGVLTAGTHTIRAVFHADTTYGADIDQFEIFRY